MNPLAAIARHAGLGAATDDLPSVSDCLGRVDFGPDLDAAVADLLAALCLLNVELNGDIPSGAASPAPDIPRQAAYGLAEVLRMLREIDGEQSAQALAVAWRIETAWLAVLAGDVDDLLLHISHEEAARQHMR